jgi:hypothetical protein
MMTAFRAMLDDVTAVNASRRQVTGLIAWQDCTRQADTLAREHGADGACLDVGYAASGAYRTWQMSCRLILAALAVQAEESRRRAAEADAEAESETQLALQAATAAAAARDQAATARAAALACTRPEDVNAFLAGTEAADAEAADAEAAAAAAAAQEHQSAAGAARRRAVALRAWEIAARDAHGTGQMVLDAEQPAAASIGDALRRAGTSFVPRDKSYLRDGGSLPAGGRS